ncbi:MAG: hypothetical protein LBM38_04925, partial [Clostridiales bacterium]|nr:hypothetical protein [Clostridiales bacterium]
IVSENYLPLLYPSPFNTYEGETVPLRVSAEDLFAAGFSARFVTDENIWKLNYVLDQYGITGVDDIRHFLSQGLIETGYGRSYSEDDNIYTSNYSGGEKYRGAGIIHITGKESYDSFYHWKKEGKCINGDNKSVSADEFSIKVEFVDDPTIIDDGYVSVAEKYPIESGAWYWVVYKPGLQKTADSGAAPDRITDFVNSLTDTRQIRNEAHEKITKIIK